MLGLITTKVGMSRVFQEDGTVVPVTYLKVDPNTVIRHRSKDRDGYNALVPGVKPADIVAAVKKMLVANPEWNDLYGDGKAGERIIKFLFEQFI